MTGGAIVGYASVIECRRYKPGGDMTNTAVLASGHMGTMLAQGDGAIVAIRTIVANTGVIKLGPSEGGGVVTHRAILGGR